MVPMPLPVRIVARTMQAIPAGLTLPPGVDPMAFLLAMPALGADQIPPGADTTMTLDGPSQVWYLVTAITCIAITGFFLLIRLYTRLSVVRSLEVADYFIFLAFPLLVGEVAVGYYMCKWGAGVHQWQITLDQMFNQLYWANIGQIVYCPLSFFVKMAILLQYLRLFAPSRSANRIMWYGAWVMIVACAIFYTTMTFFTAFYCDPRPAIWNKLTPGGKCHDVNYIMYAQCAFNMSSDIIILLLPTSGLWRLNVPLAKKVAVTMLFATGLSACIASAMRIVYTAKITGSLAFSDVSHYGLYIGLWTEAEAALGFCVACALCLPKLIQAKGTKLKRAMSKVSSPFSSLRGTIVSRAGTFRTISRSGTHSSRHSAGMYRAKDVHVKNEECETRQASEGGKLHLTVHHDQIAANDDACSQSTGLERIHEPSVVDQTKGARLAPVDVPNASATDFCSSMRSPADRLTSEQMSPEQLRDEIQTLQQFNFDVLRQSMEDAVRGNRPVSHVPDQQSHQYKWH